MVNPIFVEIGKFLSGAIGGGYIWDKTKEVINDSQQYLEQKQIEEQRQQEQQEQQELFENHPNLADNYGNNGASDWQSSSFQADESDLYINSFENPFSDSMGFYDSVDDIDISSV